MNRSFVFREQETYKVSKEDWFVGLVLTSLEGNFGEVNISVELYFRISAFGKLELFVSCNRQSDFPIHDLKIKGSFAFKKEDTEDFVGFEGDGSEIEASQMEGMHVLVHMMETHYNNEDFLKEYLHNGFLTINTEVEISWRKFKFRELKVARDTSKKLASDFSSLLTSPLTKDYVVVCQGEEFSCHRAVLEARSDTFKGGLNKGMMEGAQGR